MSDPMNPYDATATAADPGTRTIDPSAPTIAPVANRPRANATRDATARIETPPRRNPFEDVTLERPRTHPVAYGALVIAALALLLSLLGLRPTGDHGYRQVKIGNTDCVIGRQAGADVLYCRTPAAP